MYIQSETQRTITISGTAEELDALSRELKSWKPTMGWSGEAEALFVALEGEK